MKKYILLLFMITGFLQSQTLQNPTFGNTTTNTLKVKTPSTVTSVSFLPTVEADFSFAKIDPVLLPLSTATINAINTESLNAVHKIGDAFSESLGFPPLLSYNTDTSIGKRFLEPEITHGTIANSSIFAWGDSLTAGAGGTPYPTTLQGLIFSTVTNRGIGGETSTQIKDRLVLDTSNYSKSVIIWAGRNNYTSPTTVKADIATMISTIGHTRYLVVGIINGDYATEYVNQSGWTTINQLNSDLKTLYGNKFIDIRPYLVSLHDNSAQDLIDFSRDIVPTSLRSDQLHLNTTGYNKVAEYINQRLGYLYDQTSFLQYKDFNFYTSIFGIANQQAITQTAGYNISGSGIINRIISRAGTNANAGVALHHVFQSNVGSNRNAWGHTTVESGSNSGSNFNHVTFDDTGAVLGIPFTIFRSNGHVVFKGNGNTLATDAGFNMDIKGSTHVESLNISPQPTLSAGTYDIITVNTVVGSSNGNIEKVPSTTFAPNLLTGFTAGAGTITGTDTVLQGMQKNAGNVALKANINNPTFTGTAGFYVADIDSGYVGFSTNTTGVGINRPAVFRQSDKLGLKGSITNNNALLIDTDALTTTRTVKAQNKDGFISLTLGSFTVATLPTPTGTAYAEVTDALAPTYMATVVGGGSVVTPVFYNGANWVCH